MNVTLIIGASSAIARSLIKQLSHQATDRICAVARDASLLDYPNVECIQSDYSENSVAGIIADLTAQELKPAQVYICNGLLHDGDLQPEKRIENLNPAHLQQVMQANAITPMLWIKHLKKMVKGQNPCVITVFSARVGSIDDNRLGGWYAYRASKAALNMMVKNASIEFARFAKATRFLVFHPGTTDTALSKPFQKSVPEGKLFTPDFVATQLLEIVDGLERTPGIDYLDWNHQRIPW